MRTSTTTKARRRRRMASALAAFSLVIPSVALAATAELPTSPDGPIAPAPAPTQPATAAAAPPEGCEARATVTQYRSYAKRVYKRERVSKRAASRLRKLERCQPSSRDRRAVKRHKARYLRHREATSCSQRNPKACIREAAQKYNVSFAMLLRKARCESGLNPHATNGAHDGLFQFRTASPSTWATTPYGGRSPWKAKWNAMAAAWMHAQGRGAEWQCR